MAKLGKVTTDLLISNRHKFLKKINKQSDGCWRWEKQLDKDGYGIFEFYIGNGVPYKIRAHRAAYFFETNILLPSNIFVCHRCDNPPCVNPEHLFSGTLQDNVDDMKNKSRGRSILTNEQVVQIRQMLQADIKLTYVQLAKKFRVKTPTINCIANYISWQSIYVGPIPNRSKFNEEDRMKIKELFSLGVSARKIGIEFGVCHHTVLSMIRSQNKGENHEKSEL